LISGGRFELHASVIWIINLGILFYENNYN